MASTTVRLSFARGAGKKPFLRTRQLLAQPLAGGRGDKVATVMRFGPGGVTEQRQRQTYVQGTFEVPWSPFQSYPKVKPPDRLLHRTGKSDAAWAGRGQNSVTKVTANSVAVGVTGIPGVHQRGATIKPKRFNAQGIPLMWYAIGLRTGRWMNVKHLRVNGIEIPPRSVGVSSEMARAVLSTVLREIEKQSRSGAIEGKRRAVRRRFGG